MKWITKKNVLKINPIIDFDQVIVRCKCGHIHNLENLDSPCPKCNFVGFLDENEYIRIKG